MSPGRGSLEVADLNDEEEEEEEEEEEHHLPARIYGILAGKKSQF